MNNTNTIDANDTGREVQIAFYDPDRRRQNCAWNASCVTTATTCPQSITYMGWNPVQGGNRCNNGSGTDSVDLSAGQVKVTTTPLHWNPNWDRTDCSESACGDASLAHRRSDVTVVQRTRFVRTHAVEIDYTVTNLANIDHGETYHEMPTVYTSNGNQGPDLWRLFSSDGSEISIDTPIGADGFFYKNFTSPDGWVSMQNNNLDYGVGMYNENKRTGWQGWQKRSLPFNNFRAGFLFGIPSLATVRARTYLLIGSHAAIGTEATWLDMHLPAFGSLDNPTSDASVSGSLSISGWAMDNKGVATVEAVFDGLTTAALSYGNTRNDVCAVWPGYARCPSVGYTGTIDVAALGLSHCPHLLEIRVTDTDGNQRIIARRRIQVTP